MTVLLVTIGIVVGLVVLGLAAVGVWGCVIALSPRESERARIARQAREAEAHIADIGRRAQEAIIAEALYRLRSRYSGRG
jgi:hypothetical protein